MISSPSRCVSAVRKNKVKRVVFFSALTPHETFLLFSYTFNVESLVLPLLLLLLLLWGEGRDVMFWSTRIMLKKNNYILYVYVIIFYLEHHILVFFPSIWRSNFVLNVIFTQSYLRWWLKLITTMIRGTLENNIAQLKLCFHAQIVRQIIYIVLFLTLVVPI